MTVEITQNGRSKLKVDSIVMKDELMFRDKLDEDRVQQYQERYQNGFSMDPIEVYSVKGEGRLLVDGFHRLTAARRAGCEMINAVLECGIYDDAEWAAANANLTHGKALSRKERRKVVALYLRRHPERTDNWIADDVSVDHKTVRGIRKELESVREIPELNEFVGKDGKRYSRTREPSRKSRQKTESRDSAKEKKTKTSESDKTESDKSDEEIKEEDLPGADLPGEGNPAEKMEREVRKQAKTAKDLKITEWDEEGNKTVKDRDGNVIERVEGDRPPDRGKQLSQPSASSEKYSRGINHHELFQTPEKKSQTGAPAASYLGDTSINVSTIDESSKVAQAVAHLFNTIHNQEGWEGKRWEDTFKLNGMRLNVAIVKMEKDRDDIGDTIDPDDIEDDLDFDKEPDF